MSSKNITYKKIKQLKDVRTKKVIILMILIFVLVLILGLIYLTTDMFKTPKTLFYKYFLTENLNNITDISYDDFLANLREHRTINSVGEIKHRIEDKTLTDTSVIEMMDDMVTKYEINMEGHNAYLNVKTDYKNREIFNLEFVDNDLVLGIKEKDLDNQYTVIDLSKLKETLEKMGEDTTDIYNMSKFHRCELYYISQEDRKTIINTYGKHINAIIPNNDYSVEKNVEINVNGNNYKCNAYTLKMKEDELKTIYLRILNELKEDELTLNLIAEKYNMINWAGRDITKADIIKVIETRINQINLEGPGFSNLEITVYENNSRTIRTEIKRDTETICLDATRNKNERLLLLNVNTNDLKFEILLNIEKINENESQIKIIYTKDTTNFILDITNGTYENVEVNIPYFNSENSNNVTQMSEEEAREIHKLTDIWGHIVEKLQELGIPEGVIRRFIFERVSENNVNA